MWMADDLVPLTIDDVIAASKKCDCWKIFLHWSAGRYGQVYEDYHINIDSDGSLYCVGNLDFSEVKHHTWKRNTGSIGISLCCGYGAVANNGYDADFGDFPPTREQIDTMGYIVALICKYSHIDISDVLTHKEIACIDGYGVPYGAVVDGVLQNDSDLRWDLWFLPDDAYGGEMRNGGDIIRGKARFYFPFV